ncbi:FadR/GntR family transcriptional regulator [Microbacterium sp.]|uniref:FadR/GntR family transcriptional regulator n=1 Tax=Microbacterium sp. TaxID=51671 RepID=UPI003C77098A
MSDAAHGSPVHDGLVDRLGAAIVQGRYPTGARLITGDLADESGASRSAAREAVRVLESLGLVEVRRKLGVEVLPPGRWSVYAPEVIAWRLAGPDRARQLTELSQLRSAVEPLAVRLAAGNASLEQRHAMLTAVGAMAHSEHDADGAEYLAADIAFHRTLLAASGNAMLAALGDVVEAVLVGRTRHELMPHQANPAAVRWHQSVAVAIAAGRAEEAAAAMASIVAEAEIAVQRITGAAR